MTWFCAHVLIGFFATGEETWPVRAHENVLLLEAADGETVEAEAMRLGHEMAAADDSLSVGGVRGETRFLGVRQIISISNPHPLSQDEDRPVSGTEVTYLDLEIASAADLEKFVNGEEVLVTLLDTRRD